MNHTKMKKNLLFIDNGKTYKELCQILDDEYNVKIVGNMNAAKDIFKNSKADIQALLIHADLQEDIRKLWNSQKIVKGLSLYQFLFIPIKRTRRMGLHVLNLVLLTALPNHLSVKLLKTGFQMLWHLRIP